MKLHVFFSPADVRAVDLPAQDVYIVIDVIRATTAITTMFDSGASRIFAADTVEQARRAALSHPQRLLCGERHARALPGFAYGNSPAQFARTDLTGQELILTTTNGSRAFFACPPQSLRLAGCFYNAHAVTAYALQQAAQRGGDLAIVCAAENGYFALDDTTCAGYLAQELQRQQPAIEIDESVAATSVLYNSFTVPQLFEYSNSIHQVIKAGLDEDIDFCLRIDASTHIGVVGEQEIETGLLEIRPISHS
jgi:2-phosphosulfolactate phosphatase